MNGADIILIILISAAFAGAVIFCIINRRRGKSCCGNCNGCNGCRKAGKSNNNE